MATPEDIRIQEELLRLERERAGITQDNLEKQQNISNYLQQQLNLLRFEKAEKTEIRSLTRQLNKIAAEGAAITLDELGNSKSLAKIQKDRAKIEQSLTRLLSQRNTFANKEGEANQLIVEALDDQIDQLLELNSELEQAELNSRKIADNLGVKGFQVAEDIISAIPGLRQFKGSFIDATNAARKAAIDGGNAFTAGAKSLGKAATAALPLLLITKVVESFNKLNKAQVDFQRNVGVSVDRVDTLNTSLLTSVDYIEQANSLVEQFGFNAAVAFDSINIQEAAELTQLMGLSAQEANNLALFSQVNGESLKDNAAQAYKNISPLLSQRKVLQEIANVSPSIAMSFGASSEALADAASNARLLGLNLSQVDKIAEGLLDIEQSLTSEFEAEVITGRQLNLERARFFALTNDIDGVTKEIAANQEVLNTFATGTRIEQEAIAGAIGLSRDEISKMLFDQQILNGLSTEEAALRSGMSIEDAKRLTIQESINKSIAKMTEALALPFEFLASMVDNAGILYGLMGAIGTIVTVNLAKSLGSALVSMAAMIPKAMTLLGLESGRAVAAITSASAMTLGLGALGIIAATAAAVAGFKALTRDAQNVSDGIAPSSKGPFTITDSYGATAITARGDSLAVSPNIRRDDRNSGTMLDYDKLAEAIAKGAEKGTSRATVSTYLDGDRVSTRLQPSLAVNTRRYSV